MDSQVELCSAGADLCALVEFGVGRAAFPYNSSLLAGPGGIGFGDLGKTTPKRDSGLTSLLFASCI